MKRQQALDILKQQQPKLKTRYGVEKIGIFGSVARNEAGEESDVDVVVIMPPDAFDMVHVKELLEDALHTPVDLVRLRQKMNPFLKERIEKEATYV